MKQETVNIDGNPHLLNESETEVFHFGEWKEIHEDQDGEKYIIGGLGTIYFDQQPQDTTTPKETTSIPVKDELKITQGRWGIHVTDGIIEPFDIMSRDGVYIAACKWGTKMNVPESIHEVEANAKAICTAVNETYGKGYRPESFGELYQALEAAKSDYQFDGIISEATAHQIKTVLINAKL